MFKILIPLTLCGILNPKLSLCSWNQTLELVHVIFRHGDRTPEKIHLYPKDPHYNMTYASIGFGQVTDAGKLKMLSLGEALHERYKTCLGSDRGAVNSRCTDYARTKFCLELILASLFQPSSYSYRTFQDDHVLGQPYRNCPRYKQLYLDFLNSSKIFENYTETFDYLSEHAGINATSKNIFEFHFTLEMERENGLQLPDWTRSVYPNITKELVFLEYQARSATAEMKRLSAGFLLKKIIRDTRKKICNILVQNPNMFLYSGHEFNITYLMQILGIYYQHIPPYGAYVLIEIHNVEGNRRVKIFYQDYRSENPRRMEIPNCDNPCEFKQFVKLYKKNLPSSKSECFM